MVTNFRVRLHTLRIADQQESGSIFVSAGDEPYIVAVGFRSRFKTPGSTSVFWNRHLTELADSARTGSNLAIPAAMGEIEFPNVDPLTAERLLASEHPELLGQVVVAFESDATPFGAISDLVDRLQSALSGQLRQLVEGGQINVNDPGASIDGAMKSVEEAVRPSAIEAIGLFLQSFGDPDDLIGVRVRLWAGVDPNLAGLSPVAVLQPEEFTMDFSGDGAKYDVAGQVIALPQTQPVTESSARFAAVWQQDGGPSFVARHDLNADQYQQAFDEIVGQGFRLTCVNGYVVDGQERFAAVWEQDGGPGFAARHNLTSDQYQQAFDELVGQGFRLTCVSGYVVGGQERFAAIWQQDGGPGFVARHNLSSAQYQQAFDEVVGQGFRLRCVSGY